MKRKPNAPYVSRSARDAQIINTSRSERKSALRVVARDGSLVSTGDLFEEKPQEFKEDSVKSPSVDELLEQFGINIEERYKKAVLHMDGVIKEARQIVFRGKER